MPKKIYSPTFRALSRPDRPETRDEIERRYFEDVAWFHIRKPVDTWKAKEWKAAAGILARDIELRRARSALVMARARGFERENVLLKSQRQQGGRMLKGEGDQQRKMNKAANGLAIEEQIYKMMADPRWAQATAQKIADWIYSLIEKGDVKIRRGREGGKAYKPSTVLRIVRQTLKRFRESRD